MELSDVCKWFSYASFVKLGRDVRRENRDMLSFQT
jgi:hypothetical protein